MNDKKVTMNEHQWRLFEYNMSKWMMETKYILDNDEKKKFYKCANLSLGTGLLNGWLVYFLCKKYKNYVTPFARNFLSFSFGVYSSVVVNKIYRRKAYTEILTTKTSMTDKAREVMNTILKECPDNKSLIQNNDTNFKENKDVLEFKDDYKFINNDSFMQTEQETKFEEPKNISVVPELNQKILSDENNDLERQKSSFLNDSNEGKYVSWDDIRRRNE